MVITYSLGIRLLTVSGRTPIVTPAEFTDAITVVSPAEAKAAAKKAAKAARKSPLTDGQKRMALIGARACFVLSGVGRAVRHLPHRAGAARARLTERMSAPARERRPRRDRGDSPIPRARGHP